VFHTYYKPENLLLCSSEDDADLKIADFGFAKRVRVRSIYSLASHLKLINLADINAIE